MDRTGIIVVSLCAVLLVVWFVNERNYYSQVSQSQTGTNALAAAEARTAATVSNVAPASLTAPSAGTAGFLPNTNVSEQLLVLTNAHERYTFTSWGGGIKTVEMLNYPETISARWKKTTSNAGVATLNTRAPVPVLAILGEASLVGDGNFTLIKTGDGVHAEKVLPNGLRIVKEFHIGDDGLVNVTVRMDNLSSQSLPLPTQEWVIGTATPMDLDDNSFPIYGGTMWFDGTREQQISLSYFSTNTTFLFVIPHTPKTEYRAGTSNVVWAAVYNQFFTLLAMPKTPAAQVIARPTVLPPFPDVEPVPGMPLPEGIQTALVYPAQTLGTNQVIERQIILYAGPKEYRTLAHIGEQFQNHADLAMNFGSGYITFWGVGTFFAKGLLLCMNWLHDLTHAGYGLLIVLITVILRGIFWPLTAASTRSMKRMQALGPELKALQAKYKEDMQKLTQKQWELYRKHKVSPMSGCLPMLIQMPVFFGFFTMLRSAIELRGAHFLWVADLSKPDTILMIPGLNFPFNLLPLLMVGVMVWQAHLQPPSPGMDAAQAKIMRFLPLIFLVFLYSYSSGMALYMTVSTLMSVLQTKVTRMNQAPAPAAANPALTPPPKKKK
ncbi:MAG TPA: membrane protein insertase YidC [Candidatus Acidoferrales bacterium]|nr:membrane protein insertase YidC [Candidatus Acidoferrales bacterium]